MTDIDVDGLARLIRSEFGDRFPLSNRDESHEEQGLREERTRLVLQREVLPAVAAHRITERTVVLTPEEEVLVVETVIAEMFGLPNLMQPLRSPTVTDILVFGSDPVRIEEEGGLVRSGPPVVRRDRDLERIIYDVAVRRGKPFNHESPSVELELEPGVRFSGLGFDVQQRPFIAIRRATLFAANLDTLYDRGALDQAAVWLLRAGVAARLRMLFVGAMASGKTTLLRATIREIDPELVICTVESDLELNVLRMGHRAVVAMQERLPASLDGRGITPAQLMRPAMRTRAHWLIVGEVRGGEGAALVRAMQTGQGAMATVHGGSAEEGLEVLTDLVTAETGQRRQDVRRAVYRSADLVVHVTGDNQTGRWVSEIVAPSIEDDGDRFVRHRLFGPDDHAPDTRARPLSEPQTVMMRRLVHTTPSFTTRGWTGEDTYKPLQVGP